MAAGDVTISRGASVAMTISPENVATSSTRTAGVESTAVTTGSPVIDYLVSGKWTAGTSPTVNRQVDVWVWGSFEDTPTYPDVIDGTASAETITSENVRNSAMSLAATIQVDNTSDRTYWVHPFSVAAHFGGVLPKTWGIFISHDTAVNSNSTAGNHAWWRTPVYANVAQS